MSAYIKLKQIFREASLSSDIAGILHWDMSTMMPANSRNQRAEQLAYLSKLSHDKVSTNEVRDLIFKAKNEHLNIFINKISEFSNSNKDLYKKKSVKIIEKVVENNKKIKPFIKIIDEKLKDLQSKENAPNIKFSNNGNLKLKKNIFEIKESFKYKIGELLVRFLFSYSHNELFAETGGLFNVNYISQRKFYETLTGDFTREEAFGKEILGLSTAEEV